MKRAVQQIRAIVRANQALRGRGVVAEDVLAMLKAAAIAVWALNLIAFGVIMARPA